MPVQSVGRLGTGRCRAAAAVALSLIALHGRADGQECTTVTLNSISWLEWSVSLGTGFALVALIWYLAARLYHREQLATSA